MHLFKKGQEFEDGAGWCLTLFQYNSQCQF